MSTGVCGQSQRPCDSMAHGDPCQASRVASMAKKSLFL